MRSAATVAQRRPVSTLSGHSRSPWTEEEVVSMSIFDLLHPDDLEHTRAGFELTQVGQPALRFANRYRCKDGSYRWISWIGILEDGYVYSMSIALAGILQPNGRRKSNWRQLKRPCVNPRKWTRSASLPAGSPTTSIIF
jgi:hypothetical protein